MICNCTRAWTSDQQSGVLYITYTQKGGVTKNKQGFSKIMGWILWRSLQNSDRVTAVSGRQVRDDQGQRCDQGLNGVSQRERTETRTPRCSNRGLHLHRSRPLAICSRLSPSFTPSAASHTQSACQFNPQPLTVDTSRTPCWQVYPACQGLGISLMRTNITANINMMWRSNTNVI